MENISTKKRLVTTAYQIICEEGVEAATARKIAGQAGCTATLIYKYFGSLDYLLTIACFPFMDIYHERDSHIAVDQMDSLTSDKLSWHIFIECAFDNPRIYERLFWGVGNSFYEDAISEYYELFPEKFQNKKKAYFTVATFSGDLENRDLIWLRRAANEGLLDYKDTFYISKVNSYIVHGMLNDFLHGKYRREDAVRITCELVDKTMDTFAKMKKYEEAPRS